MAKNYKGQYFSLDAIISVVIFVLALSLLASYWFSAKAEIDRDSSGVLLEALSISDSLLTPGDSGWVEKLTPERFSEIRQVGFAAQDKTNELDLGKVRRFRDFVSDEGGYQRGKELLRTGKDYFIEVSYLDEGNSEIKVSAGKPATDSAAKVSVATRGILVHGNSGRLLPGTMRVWLWET